MSREVRVQELLERVEILPAAQRREALTLIGQLYGNPTGGEPHTAYRERPLDWMVEKLGVRRETLVWSTNPGYEHHEWDGTPDPLVAVCKALVEGEDVAVEAGTGTGKTFLAACLTLWFLACWEDSLVVTVAPKQDQLLLHMWKEIDRLWPRFERYFPEAEHLSGKIRMRPGDETWAATAFVAGVGADEASATKAQGWHAEHMLIITEETPGIHPAIMTALENTRTGPHNLQLSLGNPDGQYDPLHQFALRADVEHVRVSALDFPNVVADDPEIVPGAVSTSAVVRRKLLYQHTPALYESRVRGISPEKAVGVALQFNEADHLQSWPEGALAETIRKQEWPLFGGIDFGSWRFAFVLAAVDRAGRIHLIEELFSQREDLATRARRIGELLKAYEAPSSIRVWGDAANAQDIMEINRAFKRQELPYSVLAVASENKVRSASVTRLNDLLGRKALLFRRDLGRGQEWRLGQSAASEGKPVQGSRLLWEIKNWRYPDAKEGEAQKQDPDDDTADGADAIAALRYAVMSWLSRKPARYEKPERPQDTRNREYGLERYLEAENRRQEREERKARIALKRALARSRRKGR